MNTLPAFLLEPDPYVYVGGKYVVLDFETTGIDKGSALTPENRILLAVWLTVDGQLKHKWGGEFDQQELLDDIAKADFIVAHGAKFELQWLDRCGYDVGSKLVYDTMIAEYVLGGNLYRMGQLALDRIAVRRNIGRKDAVVSRMIRTGVPVENIPRSWLYKYCVQDVMLTRDLYVQTVEELYNEGQLPVMFTRCLLTPVLSDIEKHGMFLDADRVSRLLEEREREYEELETKLTRMAGGINLHSPVQLGRFLYEELKIPIPKDRHGQPRRTPSGRYPADVGTIGELRTKNKRQREFLDTYLHYRNIYSELTKYLRKFRACCAEAGGRLVAQFNQTATRTHRLSSTGRQYSTQFQNLPRIYKPLFRARDPSWDVYESDGSQLEFRVAVHLGKDERGLRDIRGGVDVHSVSAEIIGCSRQDAKAHTFKPLYGGTSGTPEQQRYYQHFKDTYRGITETQQRWINTVLKDKKLTTEWGLTFHWPDTRMTRSGYITNTTSICNYPVQSLATAEIIPIALVYMWHRVRCEGLPFLIVNTIHDSIVAEGPRDEVTREAWHTLARKSLIDDVYPYLETVYNMRLMVPLGCSAANGPHWGSKEETKYEADEELFAANLV